MIILVKVNQHHGFSNMSSFEIYKQWRSFILLLNDGLQWRKMMAKFVLSFKLRKVFLFQSNRSNMLYSWPTNRRNKTSPTFSPNKRITMYPIVIYGFRSSLDQFPVNSVESNDVLVVLFYFSSPCF